MALLAPLVLYPLPLWFFLLTLLKSFALLCLSHEVRYRARRLARKHASPRAEKWQSYLLQRLALEHTPVCQV